jgi:hypothetical protein
MKAWMIVLLLIAFILVAGVSYMFGVINGGSGNITLNVSNKTNTDNSASTTQRTTTTSNTGSSSSGSSSTGISSTGSGSSSQGSTSNTATPTGGNSST